MQQKKMAKKIKEIINKTRKTVVAANYVLCTSTLSKAHGLMFSKKKNIIFAFKNERIVPLHMLFVFFPIDVLFLDKNKKVVDIKKNFLPWTFYTPKNKAMYVVELEAGTVIKSKTNISDVILF